MKKHTYNIKVQWTGNQGKGTANYRSYTRSHSISSEGKYDEILASSDPSFLGDKSKYNPEDLFLSSISSCHMLWYLHLCSTHKIVVTDYVDRAIGIMEEDQNGSGRFKEVCLHPEVSIENVELTNLASSLHAKANKMCFIANSCNFKIEHKGVVKVS